MKMLNKKFSLLSALIAGIVCHSAFAADSLDKGSDNVTLVTSIDPTAAAGVPFPQAGEPAVKSSSPVTQDIDAELKSQSVGRDQADGKHFPDQTNYGASSPAQSRNTAASGQSQQRRSGSSTEEQMMTTKQALMEKLRPGNMSPEDIREALSTRDQMSASINTPIINSVPVISSQTLTLSPGDAIPVVRVAPGRATYIVFEDITGAPWPLMYPPINHGGANRFYVSGFKDTPIVTVQPLVTYGNGDLGILLKDLPVPISIVLANAEPSAADKAYKYDSRINLRIPRRGPMASKTTITTVNKIALSDPELQSLLDGISPDDAVRLKTDNSRVSAWRRADKLYVRSAMESRTQFSKTLSSADGTHVYEMELSPFITMLDQGSTVTVKVEL